MFDEREFIRRVEAAGPDEFQALLRTPTVQEEKALRAYLGDERYRRLHALALRTSDTRAAPRRKGNVVILHGIMGGELTTIRGGATQHVWARVFRLISGGLARLRLREDGREEADDRLRVLATGILKKHYGEQIIRLNRSWNTRTFWYDWRKPLDVAADELRARITGWFGPDARVHLVAHSMGGLVARTYVARHRAHWDSLAGADHAAGGRLLMLGTPNHGSFAVPQILTGLEHMVRLLAKVDLRHSREEVMAIVRTFAGIYEMMPSPHVDAAWEPLYRAQTWGALNVPQRHLDHARRHHDLLARDALDAGRMLYVAGSDQATWTGIADWARLDSADGYTAGYDGDGRVPHALGALAGVPTWYVRAEHGALPQCREVLAVTDELLETGDTAALSRTPLVRTVRAAGAAAQQLRARMEQDEQEVEAYLLRSRTRRGTAEDAAEPVRISRDERRIEELITRGFLDGAADADAVAAAAPAPPEAMPSITPAIAVQVTVADVGEFTGEALRPRVDALAVGHYKGVRPQQAEAALDAAISARLGAERRIITDLTDRGTLQGELGQFFIVPDEPRILLIAGMGLPGRFGVPELTLLARELLWTAGRLGRRHIATVLIGSGSGNLTIEDAAEAWLRGMKHALSGADEEGCVRRVTFVERDAARALELDAALARLAERMTPRFEIVHTPFTAARTAELKQEAQKQAQAARRRAARRRTSAEQERERAPTRVTLSLEQRTYRFGAITDSASVPERAVELDPLLVQQANDEVAASFDPPAQLMNGRVLERLLIPEDLRAHMSTDAPLVLVLDSTTARVHWEMMVQPGLVNPLAPVNGAVDLASSFLGTARGLTRQLQTRFAPPPEPPPPPRRVLRVLVVADPAEDAHLPGAEEEGAAVADLFESFNSLHAGSGSRIEVKRLFGPRDATRLNVLREVLLHSYDVLHFAGHCSYDGHDPARSGWIFSHGQVLSAFELDRIDRVPKFIVSNACESGITPDRSDERDAALAPGFAEAFFKRGVANFVCTAWPIDDLAALRFATTLYGELLGVRDGAAAAPRPMQAAMRAARLAIAATPNGIRSWGAYQHYGNPFFRLFEAERMR